MALEFAFVPARSGNCYPERSRIPVAKSPSHQQTSRKSPHRRWPWPAADFGPGCAFCRDWEREQAFWRMRWAECQGPVPNRAGPHSRSNVTPASRWAGGLGPGFVEVGIDSPRGYAPGRSGPAIKSQVNRPPAFPNPAQERLAVGRETRKSHTGRIYQVEIVPPTNGVMRHQRLPDRFRPLGG